MEYLNLRLAQTWIGCFIGGVIFNSLSYADDLVILAPTAAALNHVLSICDEYASANNIVFSTAKTQCMAFISRCENSLRVLYNNSLWWLLNLPLFCSASGMFVGGGLPSFAELRRKSSLSIQTRILASASSPLSATLADLVKCDLHTTILTCLNVPLSFE
ncbi:hypothetical protein QYM36_006190 [Artemia franciscana]|uniref:Reverse transcriptase domain-containing protein n=1 Tax=Artemia franciscana TaxID=6661 RepID=A0AA88HZR3_ARTSF|nr:hypothetical protein QYM36_006190 [Artemia franciscana]